MLYSYLIKTSDGLSCWNVCRSIGEAITAATHSANYERQQWRVKGVRIIIKEETPIS